jgi:hypothetical protein
MVALAGEGGGMMPRRARPVPALPSSAFAGFRFPPEIIVVALRWYLRYGLSLWPSTRAPAWAVSPLVRWHERRTLKRQPRRDDEATRSLRWIPI